MLDTILSALLPMVVTFLLGFIAAWRHDFESKDASTLNRMVLVYAVPLALFAGTVTTSPRALSQDIPMVVALCVSIIGLYGVVFLFSLIVLHLEASTSALDALTASAPAVPFVGPAVLGNLFGGLSAIPIAVASLVINLTVVPITILLLALDSTRRNRQEKTPLAERGQHSATAPRSHASVVAAKLVETVKEPIVWAPVLALIIVLTGFRMPQLIVHSLSLLGQASGGVALFACGIVLASGKIKLNRYVWFFVFLKKHRATRPGPGWFAMVRLWQSRQRSGADDRHHKSLPLCIARPSTYAAVSACTTRCHPAGQKLGHSEREHSNEAQSTRGVAHSTEVTCLLRSKRWANWTAECNHRK
jgi:malonate transporter